MSSKIIYNRERLLQLRTDGTPDAAPASPEARIFDVWLPTVAKASYSYHASNNGERPNFFARGEGVSSVSPPTSSPALYTAPSGPVITPTTAAAPSLWRYRTVGGSTVSNPMPFAEIAELVADDLIEETTTELARAGEESFFPFLEVKADPEGIGKAPAASSLAFPAAPSADVDVSPTAAAVATATDSPATVEPARGRYVPRKQTTHTFPGPSVLHAPSTAPVPVTATGRFGPTAELLANRGPGLSTAVASRPRVVPQVEWSRDDMLTSAELVAVEAAAAAERTPPPSRSSMSSTPQHVSPSLHPAPSPSAVDDLGPPPAWRATLAGLAASSPPSVVVSTDTTAHMTAEALEQNLLKQGSEARALSTSTGSAQKAAPAAVDDDLAAPTATGSRLPAPKAHGSHATPQQQQQQQPPAASPSPNPKDSKQHSNKGTPEAKAPRHHADPTVATGGGGNKRGSKGKSPTPPPTPPPEGSVPTSATESRSATPAAEGVPVPAATQQPKAAASSRRKRGGKGGAAEAEAPAAPAAEAPAVVVHPTAATAAKKRHNNNTDNAAPSSHAVEPATAPPTETAAPTSSKSKRGGRGKGSSASQPAAVAPASGAEPSAPPTTAAAEPAPQQQQQQSAKGGNNRRGGKAKDQQQGAAWGSVAPPPTVNMNDVMHEAATAPKKPMYQRHSGWRNAVGGGGAAPVEPRSLPSLDEVSSPKKK